MPKTLQFDVFLSHNSKNKPVVRELKERLSSTYGIKSWLDEDELRPGFSWQKLLEDGIIASASVAVLVGADGLGPWEAEEMQAALQLAVENGRPVMPVLLPGAPRKPKLPLFLRNRTWVDLRGERELAAGALDKLVWGITGRKPTVPSDKPDWRYKRIVLKLGLAAFLGGTGIWGVHCLNVYGTLRQAGRFEAKGNLQTALQKYKDAEAMTDAWFCRHRRQHVRAIRGQGDCNRMKSDCLSAKREYQRVLDLYHQGKVLGRDEYEHTRIGDAECNRRGIEQLEYKEFNAIDAVYQEAEAYFHGADVPQGEVKAILGRAHLYLEHRLPEQVKNMAKDLDALMGSLLEHQRLRVLHFKYLLRCQWAQSGSAGEGCEEAFTALETAVRAFHPEGELAAVLYQVLFEDYLMRDKRRARECLAEWPVVAEDKSPSLFSVHRLAVAKLRYQDALDRAREGDAEVIKTIKDEQIELARLLDTLATESGGSANTGERFGIELQLALMDVGLARVTFIESGAEKLSEVRAYLEKAQRQLAELIANPACNRGLYTSVGQQAVDLNAEVEQMLQRLGDASSDQSLSG